MPDTAYLITSGIRAFESWVSVRTKMATLTALNGKPPIATNGANGGVDVLRGSLSETTNGQALSGDAGNEWEKENRVSEVMKTQETPQMAIIRKSRGGNRYETLHSFAEDRREQNNSGLALDEQSALYRRLYSGWPNSVHEMDEMVGGTTSQVHSESVSPSGRSAPMYLGRCSGPKRKKKFGTRTKTGCLTCRKRKKKCDETKPELVVLGAVLSV